MWCVTWLEFPAGFSGAAPKAVQELIQWLLHPDPAQRPSAEQVLHSHLLPPRSEVEIAYLEEAVKVHLTVLPGRSSPITRDQCVVMACAF